MPSTVTVRVKRQFFKKHNFLVTVEIEGRIHDSFEADTRSEAYRIYDDILRMAKESGARNVRGA